MPKAIKALKMLGQSTLNLKLHILDCFDFLQKSRNDWVGGIVIARFGNAESWQSKLYRHSERSEESILAIRESHSIRLHCTNLIVLILSWLIYFTHCFKTRALDTSLRNATLSMTKMFGLLRPCYARTRNDELKKVVILSATARSIHFGDFRILRDSITLSESKNNFGLLRRLQRLAMTIRRRFVQFTRFATFHTTHKGIKMQT